MVGKTIDDITIIKATNERTKQGYIVYECVCKCGKPLKRTMKQLGVKSKYHSCDDCYKSRHTEAVTKHGDSRSRLYSVYTTMIQRCTNPNAHGYENYGGRGITVCNEWMGYRRFKEWAMANGYKETERSKCTIDRIDPNGDYCPSNCRFVDMKSQQRNKRNNVSLTYKGETHCLSEWAEIVGTKYITICKRKQKGWTSEEVLFGR